LLDTKIEHFVLPTADAGKYVAHAVVVAEFGMFVGKTWVAGLLRPEARPVHPGLVPGDEHAAAGGRDDLIPIERVDPDVAERTGCPIAVYGAECFGGVFEHWHVIASADRQDRIHVRALAIQIYNDHSAGQLVPPRALPKRAIEDVRVQVPCGAVAIQKYRLGPQVTDRIATCGERQSRTEHFVIGTDSEQAQAQVDGSGPAAQCNRGQANVRPKRVFEGVDVWPDRGEPIRREGLLHIEFFLASHVRNGQEYTLH